MAFSWKTQTRPIIALSPMADMTDSAFCRTVKTIANPIMFREMISSEALVRGNDKTKEMGFLHESEHPIIQQLFGSDPSVMAEAARIVEEEFHPEGIDINMGCPVYKITSNFNGAALMKDPERAKKIVRAMKQAVSIPVTVKMRAGWDAYDQCIEFAKVVEEAGADLVTVHGRTKVQGYSGFANREAVANVKKAVSIPVLYNGDVFKHQDFFDALEQTQCDGVLIARGGLGNPWIFRDIEDRLAGKVPEEVSFEERLKTVLLHLDLHLEQYGEGAITTFRKHLSWYFKGIPHMKEYKSAMMTAKSKEELLEVLNRLTQKT